jgi:helicase
MIEEKLKLWIAQSESWHSFLEFNLPVESKAKYNFLERPSDFYITLFSKLNDLLNEKVLTKEIKEELFAIGKGLEIFSLEETREEFKGVNFAGNMLYVGAIYYLSGYPTSSYILTKLFNSKDYHNEVERFIFAFLSRDLSIEGTYIYYLRNYIQSGDEHWIEELEESFNSSMERCIQNNPYDYISYKIAISLLFHFRNNNIWKDLKEFADFNENTTNIWNNYINNKIVENPPIWTFFPSQRKVLKRGILTDDEAAYSLQMPTSAGKTALCELLIFNHLKKYPGSKILFLAPFRSLASELKTGLSKRLDRLNVSSRSIYGGNVPTEEEKNAIKNVDLVISTPEKFIAVSNILPDVFSMFSLIICDEGHLLDDVHRGLSYELLLSKLKDGDEERNRRFIFLSAILPNISEINGWLGGNADTIITSDYRPTELEYGFLKEMKKKGNYLLDVNPTKQHPYNYQLYNFLRREDFYYIKESSGRRNTYNYKSKKSISVAIALKSLQSGTVALYTPQKGQSGVKGIAEEVVSQLELLNFPNPINYSNRLLINQLYVHFIRIFGRGYTLTQLVKHGAVYHHGDLPQNVREIIEQAIRNADVRMVICTNTLAEGVNLPIKALIIHSTIRYNPKMESWENIKIRDLKNLVGRAGRAGKETKGMIIVPNQSDYKNVKKVIKDQGNEEASGFLYLVVDAITKYIKKKRIVISNELLEKQNEEFLLLLDSIDSSIVNLLSEEVDEFELENEIKLLIEKTFAYYKSDIDAQNTLSSIFHQRGEKIGRYINTTEFTIIKKSSADIRLYENLIVHIDLEDSIWNDFLEPYSEEWINYIIDLLFKLPQVRYKVEDFNQYSSIKVDSEKIKKLIKLWISGEWYGEIASQLNLDIDYLLKVISSIINPVIQNFSSKVIRLVENISSLNEYTTSEMISLWPQYLLYGLNQKGELDLIELGISDRDGVKLINYWLLSNGKHYTTLRGLKRLLLNQKNQVQLKIHLEKELTDISYKNVLQSIEFLYHQKI